MTEEEMQRFLIKEAQRGSTEIEAYRNLMLLFTAWGAAHSNDSGRYEKFASQNRPSLLNHIFTECAVYAHS